MKFFAGTSNLPLAKKITDRLKISLGDAEIKRFSDGECRVWVKEEVKKRDAFVLQSLSTIADCNLMELCLLGSALKHLKAKSITAIIPWLGYSKQDKEFRHGEAVSAQLVAKFLETAGFNKIITLELHSTPIKKYFSIPVVELSTKELLAREISIKYQVLGIKYDGENLVVISPDKGGRSRADAFAEYVNLPVAHLDKFRDLSTGKLEIRGIDRDVSGKNAVIFDDMINTGGTAIVTAEFLKKKGVKRIFFLATHAILCGEASKKLQESPIDRVVVTDTICIPKEKLFPKLKVVSVAGLIAKEIKNQKYN